jgi:hypothetical protein
MEVPTTACFFREIIRALEYINIGVYPAGALTKPAVSVYMAFNMKAEGRSESWVLKRRRAAGLCLWVSSLFLREWGAFLFELPLPGFTEGGSR